MIDFTPIVTFPLGPLTIYVHGLMMGIGMLVAYFLIHREVKQGADNRLQVELVDAMVLWAVVGGMIGARLLYVSLNYHLYDNIIEVFKIWEGGIVSFGGFIGGMVAVLLYLRYKKAPIGAWTDLLTPYLWLGLAIGRIGDFLSWAEIGSGTSLPWGIVVAGDVPRHPAQIYSTIVLLLITWWLLWLRKEKKLFSGGVALAGFAVYGLFRFLIEYIRDYPGSEYLFFYRDFAQIVSGLFVVLAGGLFVVLWKKHHTTPVSNKKS